MEQSSIAKPYVSALLSLCKDDKAWIGFLAAATALSAHPLIIQLNQSSKIVKEKRQQVFLFVLAQMLVQKISKEESNFIKILFHNGRLGLLAEIYQQFQDEIRAQHKHLLTVRSAYKLSPGQLNTLEKELAKQYENDVMLKSDVDKDLIAGIIIKDGDKVSDYSVLAKLEKLKTLLYTH